MFGYVRPLKGELKVNEYEEYKAVYCTLCKSISEHYGRLQSFFLSYDLTFYVLLSLNEGFEEKNKCCVKGKCIFNPFKKCNYVFMEEEIYKKAAALTVMMSYGKILDNSLDEKGIKKLAYKFLKVICKKAYKKASSDYPFISEALSEMLKAQSEAEKSDMHLDACCEPTANMLKTVCGELSKGDSFIKPALENLGYFLGRWIYTIDAADDLEEDLKSKSFNPLIKKFGLNLNSTDTLSEEKRKYIEEECNYSLNGNVSMMIKASNLLNNGRYSGIISNIINLGLPEMQREIIFLHVNKKDRKKKHDK